MERERSIAKVDESLALRVAAFSPGGQRWLKTALQAIATSDLLEDGEDERPPEERHEATIAPAEEPRRVVAAPPVEEEEPTKERPASLEDVITGKADLRDHLESYPELQDELEGLADVIDLLREAGESRRKRGEQILREEILGDGAKDDTEIDGEDEIT
jgi:hypothetical protein